VNNFIQLTAVDAGDRVIPDVTWESGSPDIAMVDPTTGKIKGVKRGFATITARKGADSVSTFLGVALVESNKGVRVPGGTKSDREADFYISEPLKNVIMKKAGFAAAPVVFAGKDGMSGFNNTPQNRTDALFSGPTAVAVDNSADGGVYIADTLNHSIRKIGFDN